MAAAVLATALVVLCCGTASGESLYGEKDPGMHSLERRTVSELLYNSSSAWLLEFYSSWCGHCINYAPTWRSLAQDVQDWQPAIKIGALNCADEDNTAVCKDYGVQFYPTFRFFRAFTKEFTQGENYKDSDREVPTLRHVIIDYLQGCAEEHQPPDLPPLEPFSSSDITSLLGQKKPHYSAIIFEEKDSYVGREVILDLMPYEKIAVRRAAAPEKGALDALGIVSLPSCYLIFPNGTHGLINIAKPLRSVFSSHLKSLPLVRKKAGAHSDLPARVVQEEDKQEAELWKDYDRAKVYAADLESGLHYLLRVELATHKSLEGEKLRTFKDLITILYKLFPGRPHVVKLLETLQEWLTSMPLEKIPYDAILDLVNNKMRISGIFLTNRVQWVGCQGSRSQLRGYPCSLWQLFHILTVQAASRPGALAGTAFAGEPQAVLKMVRRYIREFFGCRECAQHFEEMAAESVDVKTAEEAVLWLWRKHNVVNDRLAGAPSEDPKSPKVQWPTPDLCPSCHEEVNGLHNWNEKEVLDFLNQHYSSGVLSLRHADPNLEREEEPQNKRPPSRSPEREDKARDPPKPVILDQLMAEKGKRSEEGGGNTSVTFLTLGFSNIDMSLCVVLYVTSSLFLMIMYFFFRVRSRRWRVRHNKPYV